MSRQHDATVWAAFEAITDVSRETRDRLDHYAGLLLRWTVRINLISAGTVPEVWTRHLLDSAQLLHWLPEGSRHWVDVGSGGGLPGLVCAILAAPSRPDVHFTLVESDRRKAAFLATAVRELGLPTSVRADRIEMLAPLGADVISARAVAPLDRLFALSLPHLQPGGRLLLPKGTRADEEIVAAQASWRFTLASRQSITDPDARILCCEEIARV